MKIRSYGFTLIELMIVVAIITTIAALTVPLLFRSRLSANEASAIASMCAIAAAQAQVISQSLFVDPDTGSSLYATMEQLHDLDPPPLVRGITEGNHIHSGYVFSIDLSSQSSNSADYNAYCLITAKNVTGSRNFYMDPSAVLYFTTDGSIPNINSPTM